MIYHSLNQLIGHTPLVKIQRLDNFTNLSIYGKLEYLNPAGSVKDRVASFLIADGEKHGLLSKDKKVIEASSGNTGIGLAMLCAVKGYDCIIVMPESVSEERKRILWSYGAKVILTSAEKGTDGSLEYVIRTANKNPEQYYHPNQYDNPVNWRAHYETTASEILDDTGGDITHFVAGLGTSGTLMGVAKKLKEELDEVSIVSVEPSPETSIPGLKNIQYCRRPAILNDCLIDRKVFVNHQDAIATAERLAQTEGLFVGHSSGAAMYGAIEIAKELNNTDKSGTIVVLFPDSGTKYLSSSSVW
ncbi:MAG: Cysteine synthase [Candidatus Thorarchaeota archaeon]|nr:MAG: Cysteine synthase [Candidatus Thorarchaeota archaeon]